MSVELNILQNMVSQGVVNMDNNGDGKNMAYTNTNEGNIVIEIERKDNINNFFNNDTANNYIVFIRFKDIIINRYLLELKITDIRNIAMLLDMINEWYSFNCYYDFIYPLFDNTYDNNTNHNLQFSIEKDNNNKNEYILYVNQYDKSTDTSITRLRISMGYDDSYIQEFLDTVFFICCIDLPEFNEDYNYDNSYYQYFL